MKISTREIEDRQLVVEIEVDEERVQRAVDQAYRRIAQRVNVRGFRKGRAPRPLVERMVGAEAVMDDAVEHLVPEVFKEAVREEQIEVGGTPSLELTSRQPFQVKATVPLKPRVVLGEYRSIRLDVEEPKVSDQEVERIVERLREAHAEWVPVERAVQQGDRVTLDVRATAGERQLLDEKNAEFLVDPKGPEPTPGFSVRLYGLEPGQERTFTLQQPARGEGEDPPSAEYTVVCHEVKERRLPEVDDDLASQVGDYETVEALREAIRRDLLLRADSEARERHREAVAESAVMGTTVEVPPQLVEQRAQAMANQLAENLDRQGISLQQYFQIVGKDEQQIRDEFIAEGRKSVVRQLVLEAVADAEGIEVSEAEVREYIRLAAQTASDPRRAARAAQESRETRQRVEGILRTRRALDGLVAIATGTAEQGPAAAASQEAGATNA